MAYYHYYYYYLFIIFYYCNYYYLRLIQLRPCITHAYQAKGLQKKCCDLSLASNLPQFDLMTHGRLPKKKKQNCHSSWWSARVMEDTHWFCTCTFQNYVEHSAFSQQTNQPIKQTKHLSLVFDRLGLQASYFISFLFVS